MQESPFSICICTYNRSAQLEKTLASLVLARQSLMEGDEILVVDNNSDDATRQVVQSYYSSLPVKFIFEATQGLSAARNTGLREFIHDSIIFFDDDVSINEICLQTYRSALGRYHEHGFFGGRIRVEWSAAAPRWLQSDDLTLLNGLFGIYAPAESDLQLDASTPGPYGANFALRRQVVDQLGLFDTRLGVSGDGIARGEETEYFQRAHEAGLKGMYLAQAAVGHRFQLERITMPYLYRYGIEKGRAAVLLNNATSRPWVGRSCSFILRGFWQLLKGRRDRFYQCVINVGIERGQFLQAGKVAGHGFVDDPGKDAS